jgi:glycosyltransferase involved in cell wall biosynthesis
MTATSLVSAIIIFLNGEAFIEEAIQSVFAQTYEHWELLLVDDGSSDGSTAIAQKYAQQLPDKVRYLEHEGHQNRGMSASRNLGISHSQGEFVAFLDADDIWLPHKLERQIAAIHDCPRAGMVANPTMYWYSWSGNSIDQTRDCLREIGVPPNQCYEPPILLSRLLRNQVNAPATCGVLIRRYVVDAVGGFEESFRGLFEDRAFFSKVYLKVPVYVTDQPLDYYRQHPDSTCHVAQKIGRYSLYKRSDAHFAFLQWLEQYLLQQNVQDQEVWNALRISYLPYQNLPLHYLYQIAKRVMIAR